MSLNISKLVYNDHLVGKHIRYIKILSTLCSDIKTNGKLNSVQLGILSEHLDTKLKYSRFCKKLDTTHVIQCIEQQIKTHEEIIKITAEDSRIIAMNI